MRIGSLIALLSACCCSMPLHAQLHPAAVRQVVAVLDTDGRPEVLQRIDAEHDPSGRSGEVVRRMLLRLETGHGSETEVERRSREVREEANRRWVDLRIERGVPSDAADHIDRTGWFTSDGQPIPVNWPWWLW